MQRACAILPTVACPALQYFATLSHKRQVFRGKKAAEHKMCFDFLYKLGLKHCSIQEELSKALS
jgi:hypothetical protein